MYNFLAKDVNFSDYPCLTTHIKGIPIITYEGILQEISTRILLYSLSASGTYNNRAISTLGIKNFFSSLSKADFTMTGCPKSMQIHKIIPVMMQYNTHKHDPDKIFKMDQRRGTPYPSSNLEQKHALEENALSRSQFKPHNFDVIQKEKHKRFKCSATIGGINDLDRGQQTLRSNYYTYDTSKLTNFEKLSLQNPKCNG